MGEKQLWFIDTENLPVMKLSQPINTELRGIYGRSFAYYILIERLPRIINKITETCHKEADKIKSAHNASDDDLKKYIQHLTKLKSDLAANKCYDFFIVDTPEAKKWNAWIESQNNPRYFTNIFLYSECYVYRKIREASELCNGLASFDPFEDQKTRAFESTVEMMCVVAERLGSMLVFTDKKKQMEDFISLIKLCLWSNQCDLSLTVGGDLNMDAGAAAVLDPFEMIKNFKDKLLVDQSQKVADYVLAKTENLAKAGGEGVVGEEIIFDIVCDNAGYELFTDLCLAHFLIAQKIVQKVRFHVKDIPWLVSDVTARDFKYVIQASKDASFSKTVGRRVISSEPLRKLGSQWQQYAEDGTFVVMHDEFWTSPHMYKDMKKYDPGLYVRLQDAVAVMFKGDLNCRKLLNEVYWPTTTPFDHVLQGFHPTAVISVRTVKAELICSLPPGKADELNKLDEQWMQTGEYGMIIISEKIEHLKI